MPPRVLYLMGDVLRAVCARCAQSLYSTNPSCTVVLSINNNEVREYWVRSPSPPPSPSQPCRSLLASLEAKRRDPPPSRWSNTPLTSVSQPRAASWPARYPSTLTASSPSVPAQRTLHSQPAPGLGHLRSWGRSPSPSTSKPRPKRGPDQTTAHSRQNEKERNTTAQPICASMALEGYLRHLDGSRP